MILIDASVGLKWFLQEPDADLAEQLSLEHDLAAPTLFVVELANGLWKAARAGAMTTAQATAALATIDARIDRFLPDHEVAQRALDIACRLDHAVYDCVYLAHCERDGQQLVTADQRLLDRVAGTVFATYCVPLRETAR